MAYFIPTDEQKELFRKYVAMSEEELDDQYLAVDNMRDLEIVSTASVFKHVCGYLENRGAFKPSQVDAYEKQYYEIKELFDYPSSLYTDTLEHPNFDKTKQLQEFAYYSWHNREDLFQQRNVYVFDREKNRIRKDIERYDRLMHEKISLQDRKYKDTYGEQDRRTDRRIAHYNERLSDIEAYQKVFNEKYNIDYRKPQWVREQEALEASVRHRTESYDEFYDELDKEKESLGYF